MPLRRALSVLATLAGVGFLAMTPILLLLPTYPDELLWTLISARYFLDGGRLVYLAPVCANGFLNAAPITWYPYWIVNSLIFGDLSDIHRLRIFAVCTSAVFIFGVAWFLPRVVPTVYGLVARIGIVCACLSLGVMPFLMAFSRPEQHVLVIVSAALGLAVLVSSRKKPVRAWEAWMLAAAYALLAASLLAAHVKGAFLLPALLVAAAAAIRRPVPWLATFGVALYSCWETYAIWRDRTNCPESPFLTQIFQSLSLSPRNLAEGIGPFLHAVKVDLSQSFLYWQRVEFLPENQSGWLPNMTFPPTVIERFVNQAIPAALIVAYLVIAAALLSAIYEWMQHGRKPAMETLLALCLAAFPPVLAVYQGIKNFYEASLIFPIIGLAVIFSLHSLIRLRFAVPAGRILLTVTLLVGLASQAAFLNRFYGRYSVWSKNWTAIYGQTENIRNLAGVCGLPADGSSSRVMMDMPSYPALWRTREPLFLEYMVGYWGTGIDQDRLLRERNVSAIVGACYLIPPKFQGRTIGSQGYCCVKLK